VDRGLRIAKRRERKKAEIHESKDSDEEGRREKTS
jgi:hypothetical protein